MAHADETLPDPSLADLMVAVMRETMLRVWCSLPARVVAYYPPGDEAVGGGRQPARVDLLISIKRGRVIDNIADLKPGEELEPKIGEEEDDRLLALSDYPPIPRAVVVRASAGDGTMRLRGPVTVGQSGVALFSSRSLDRWATREGQTDPVWTHAHEITDAFFLPDAREGPAEVDDPAAAGLWSDDASCSLTFTPGPVDGVAALTAPALELGVAPSHHPARSEAVDAAIADLKAKIFALASTGNPIADLALNAIKGAVAAWSPPSTACTAITIPAS